MSFGCKRCYQRRKLSVLGVRISNTCEICGKSSLDRTASYDERSTTKHIVMFSGGIAGDEMARRVKSCVADPSTITLLFADTLIEDADLYRFRDESARHHNLHLEVVADGRTTWEVFRDARLIGNSRIDPCSKILKRDLLRKWLNDNCDPNDTVVYIGYDWTEPHRIARSIPFWEPWTVAFPLDQPPFEFKDKWLERSRQEGVEPPRLYKYGFPHNNCAGACVKAGQSQWVRLLRTFPDVYAWHEAEEERTQVHIGTDRTILWDSKRGEPLSLKQLRKRIQKDVDDFDKYDEGGCSCMEPD